MIRRFALLLAFGLFAYASAAEQRNVVFLIADDLNCDLGAYGAKEMYTPHIDRLAARGVRFDHAYCQYPLCSPSRASLLTGRRPNVTGVLYNPTPQAPLSPHFREKIPSTITLPQLFKQQGWTSVRIGKLYHYGVPGDIGTSSLDDPRSWDFTINPRGLDRESHSKIFSLEPGQFGATLSWLADDIGRDEDHTDGIAAAEATRMLERLKRENRPFFLAVGFYRPHTPYVAPKKYFDLYPRDKIVLPTLSADDRSRTPPAGYGSAIAVQDKMNDDQRRAAIQAYHASISFMDAQVGRVIDTVDRLGLAKDTIIVFTSDHGYHMGDHGLWQKRSLFERSARVPLIIVDPDTRRAGSAANAPVELLDVYPTLAGLCGLKTPAYLDGTTLVPMLTDPGASVREAAITQTRVGQTIEGIAARTSRWRYIEWRGLDGSAQGEQLFDEIADPAETNNVVNDPAHADTVSELRGLIAKVRARK